MRQWLLLPGSLLLAVLAWQAIRARIMVRYWLAHPVEFLDGLGIPLLIPILGYLFGWNWSLLAISIALSVFIVSDKISEQYQKAIKAIRDGIQSSSTTTKE